MRTGVLLFPSTSLHARKVWVQLVFVGGPHAAADVPQEPNVVHLVRKSNSVHHVVVNKLVKERFPCGQGFSNGHASRIGNSQSVG